MTKYGNHPFNYLFEDRGDEITFKAESFYEAVRGYRDQFLSPVYIGWRPGYAPSQFSKFNTIPEDIQGILVGGITPYDAFTALTEALAANPAWLDQV